MAQQCWIEQQQAYTPPQYVGINDGDVVLLPTVGQSLASVLMSSVGLQFTHTALSRSSAGYVFTDTSWNGNAPPSTASTGGSHACSRVIDSGKLQNLMPGTTGQAVGNVGDVMAGATIVPGFGQAGCTAPPDSYHFNSFIHDDTRGGSCEKYLVDFCGVPVTPADKFTLPGNVLNEGLLGVYGAAYGATIGSTSGLPWIDYAACGGVDATILAQRGTNQVINEIRWKWMDLYLPNGQTTDTLGQDWNAVTATVGGIQENLGGAAQNTQWGGGYDYCMNVNQSNQQPGANCPSWTGRIPTETDAAKALTMNVPDNILTAANRLGAPSYIATVTPGYYTTVDVEVCPPPVLESFNGNQGIQGDDTL